MAYNEELADRVREIIAQTHKKVEEDHAIRSTKELNYWVQLALDYNRIARSSKKSSSGRTVKNKKTSTKSKK